MDKTKRMKFEDITSEKVFRKTDGCCHICHKKLVFKNYGLSQARVRGKWEIAHSKPISKGGNNHLNNYMPACVSCNRSKGNCATFSERAKNGLSIAPVSKKVKFEQARNRKLLRIGAAGMIGLRFGPVDAAVCMAVAAAMNT
mgnify:CR=1 FL=1|jgi:hypothetical protein